MRSKTQAAATFATRRFAACGLLAAFGLLSACSADQPQTWDMDGDDVGTGTPSATDTPGVVNPPGTPVQPGSPGVTPSTSVTPGTTVTPGQPAPTATAEPVIPPGDPIPIELDGTPSLGQLVRLTHAQWANSVQQLLALESLPVAADSFAPDAIVGNFSNNEKYLTTTQTLVSDYERAVEDLVDALTDQQLAKIYSGTDSAGFIATFGRRAYRRPLTDEEIAKYTEIYTAGTELTREGSAFLKGAGLVIQVMLQSPYFIYRTELEPAGQTLTGYELAAKLSLSLLDVTPSDQLLAAAEAGQLDTPEGVGAQATQILNDPRAVNAMRRFHGETLQFKRFDNLHKESSIVPEFTDTMEQSAKEAAYLFFDDIFTKDQGLAEIFTSTTGYMNGELAALYDLPAPSGNTFQQADLGAERPGYFAQIPFLLLHSVNYLPDPIHRGVDLGLRMLCAHVDSPDFVPPSPPAPQPGQSNREVIALTTSPEVCNNCHGYYINPLGFAFENFDGLGRFRTEDNGKAVDASGTYPFTEGDKTFSGHVELMNTLVDSEQAHQCYAKNMMQFVLGRELKAEDMPEIESLGTLSQTRASVKELIVALVKSPAFRTNGGGVQ